MKLKQQQYWLLRNHHYKIVEIYLDTTFHLLQNQSKCEFLDKDYFQNVQIIFKEIQ